jgi:hypothetical protein
MVVQMGVAGSKRVPIPLTKAVAQAIAEGAHIHAICKGLRTNSLEGTVQKLHRAQHTSGHHLNGHVAHVN